MAQTIETDNPHKRAVYPAHSSFLERLAEREQRFGIVPLPPTASKKDRLAQLDKLESHMEPTPLEIFRADHGSTIWAARVSDNPWSESHYDRATLPVLRTLIEQDLLPSGATILEGTSGSAGRSFASIGRYLGHPVTMLVPNEREFPEARMRDIAALGTNVVRVVNNGGIGEVVRQYGTELSRLKVVEGYDRRKVNLEGMPVYTFRKGDHVIVAPNHSDIIITPNAFGSIGQDVLNQLPSGVTIDTFIATLGNGSTVKGISEVLNRAQNSRVTVIGTETRKSPTTAIRKTRETLIAEGQYLKEAFKRYNKKADEPEAHAALADKFIREYGIKMPEEGEQSYHDSFGSSTPGYEPRFIEPENIDHIVLMGDEWRNYKRRVNTYAIIGNNEMNSIGNTSAENLYTAIMFGHLDLIGGRNILVLLYDKGDQYEDWPPEKKEYTYPLPLPAPSEIPTPLHKIARLMSNPS